MSTKFSYQRLNKVSITAVTVTNSHILLVKYLFADSWNNVMHNATYRNWQNSWHDFHFNL